MALKECRNGHYYNDSEYDACPYCNNGNTIGKTVPLDGGSYDAPAPAFNATEYLQDVGANPTLGQFGATVAPESDSKFSSTVMIDPSKNSDIAPVRGWLVVIEGKKLGLDYRIHTGKNSVGRAKSNDITIDFDSAISSEKACFVIYDEKNNAFHLMSGESTNNIYVNAEILLAPRKLVDNDIIEIGNTKLVFRSLCNDQFQYAATEN